MRYVNKILKIEKISTEHIAKKFSTPSYCYSYNQLKKNIENFKKKLSIILTFNLFCY